MKEIITLGGSSSRKSINKKLAEYTGGLLRGVRVRNLDLNDYDLPLFSVDLEKEHGFPKDLLVLNGLLEEADGFIISLAEHNGAYTAAFKNAFDWLSRMEGKVWRDKPVLLLSSSPGARGGRSVLEIALNRFPRNGGNIIGAMPFPSFDENFRNGEVTDERIKAELTILVEKFENAI